MELRAHHLICMPMYSGHGYSGTFCEHMSRTIEKIRTTDEPIRVLASPDEVCICCPNLLPAVPEEESTRKEKPETELPGHQCRYCEHEEKTSRKDQRLMEELRLECGQTYSQAEIRQHLDECFTEEVFEISCGKCSWREQGLCSFELWKRNTRMLFGT